MREAFMRSAVIVCVALVVGFGAAPAALAQSVGVMTAFQTLVSREGGPALGVGADIFLGDHLVSNETGLGMIVFDDESSAKIGPNASLIIDSFVYDPDSRSGASNLQLNSGLIRLYGGQLSKSGDMQVTTPHVVLGARGGIMEAFAGPDDSIGILRAGQLTCILGDIIKIITNPGFGCASDGERLTIEEYGEEIFEILDSLDEIAGGGEPGDPGGGFDTDVLCASAVAPFLGACQSADGSLPGAGGGLPDAPAGDICEPWEDYYCYQGEGGLVCYCTGD
jgi:hypothetical protein